MVIFHRLRAERPLYYANNSQARTFSKWFVKKGRPQDALHVLEESLTICCSVKAMPAIQQNFAKLLYQKAKILHFKGDFDNASKALSQVIDVHRRFLEEDEKDSRCFIALLSAFNLLFSCLVSLGHQSEAIQTIDVSLDALGSSLMNIDLDDIHIEIISDILISQESMLQSMDNTDAVDKLREYKKALTCVDEVIRTYRQHVLNNECEHSNLAHLLNLRHEILIDMRQFDYALSHIQESVDLRHDLVREVADEKSRMNLIRVLHREARCLNSMQRMDDALESLDEALKCIQLVLNEKQGGKSNYLFIDILDFHENLVNNLVDRNEYLTALQVMTTSAKVLRSLDSAGGTCVRVLLGIVLGNNSFCCYKLQRFEEALRYAEETVQIFRGLVTENADEHEWNLAYYLCEYARSLFALENLDGAMKSIEECIEIRSRIELRYPDGIRDYLEYLLRAEISYRLGRVGDIQDALSETWVITT